MGRSAKRAAKSANEAQDVVDAAPTKPLKKGKRGAENGAKDSTPAKKQKVGVKVKTKNATKALPEEDISMPEQLEVTPAENGLTPAVVPSDGHIASMEKDASSGDIDNETRDAENDVKVDAALELEIDHDKDDEVCEVAPGSADDTHDEKLSPQDAAEDGNITEENDDAEEAENETEEGADIEMDDPGETKNDDGKETPAEDSEPQATLTSFNEKNSVYVGNLPYSATEDDVKMFFNDIGDVVDVRLSMRDGAFKGYGHVEFVSYEVAKRALHELNGKEFQGRRLKLDMAKKKTPTEGKDAPPSAQNAARSSSHTVFVRGFNKSAAEGEIKDSLEELFSGCGEITRISIPKDDDGEFKGFAYLDFTDAEAYTQALKLNGSEFGDFTLSVQEAKPKAERRDSGGRFGGGRGGGRGRDRGGRGGGRGRDRDGGGGRGRDRDGGGGRGRDHGRGGGRGRDRDGGRGRGRGGGRRSSSGGRGRGSS